VRGAAQKLIDQYRLGVALASVNIESAQPPPEARDAFNDVASARADSARIVNEALGYAGDIVPKARGEASQSLQAAVGYREKKVNEARGDASRFTQVAAEYERAAAVNGRRLYAETWSRCCLRSRRSSSTAAAISISRSFRKQDTPKP
jgi:membrane protease subunit HflK